MFISTKFENHIVLGFFPSEEKIGPRNQNDSCLMMGSSICVAGLLRDSVSEEVRF